MEPNQENILFEIELASSFWDQPPRAAIMLDNHCKYDGAIDSGSQIIKFDHTLDFARSHRLIIDRYNKTPAQSQQGRDQLMYINKIIIDGIDIENFIQSRATFQPIYPEPWASQQLQAGIELQDCLLGETCLGHNGRWCFEFTAPFWQFLIRAMN